MSGEEKKFSRPRQAHGWFAPGPKSYTLLLKHEVVKDWVENYSQATREAMLYAFKKVLDYAKLTPKELLALPDREVKKLTLKVARQYLAEGKPGYARRIIVTMKSFLAAHDRELKFKHGERLKTPKKKFVQEYIPSKYDIYRMADVVFVNHPGASIRNKAMILCQFQSGVRIGCLLRWTYGMVKDHLYNPHETLERIRLEIQGREDLNPDNIYKVMDGILVPVRLKITHLEDTKLSAYGLPYYYTFLGYEAAKALKDYIEYRKSKGWKPKNSDLIFVTESTTSIGKPLEPKDALQIIKNVAKTIGLDPKTIWTHCLRKAFRKVLYNSGLDPDISEAMMGHMLPGSRTSYFDYHDVNEAAKWYVKCDFSRNGLARLNHVERRLKELEEENVELRQVVEDREHQIKMLEARLKEYEGKLGKVEALLTEDVLKTLKNLAKKQKK